MPTTSCPHSGRTARGRPNQRRKRRVPGNPARPLRQGRGQPERGGRGVCSPGPGVPQARARLPGQRGRRSRRGAAWRFAAKLLVLFVTPTQCPLHDPGRFAKAFFDRCVPSVPEERGSWHKRPPGPTTGSSSVPSTAPPTPHPQPAGHAGASRSLPAEAAPGRRPGRLPLAARRPPARPPEWRATPGAVPSGPRRERRAPRLRPAPAGETEPRCVLGRSWSCIGCNPAIGLNSGPLRGGPTCFFLSKMAASSRAQVLDLYRAMLRESKRFSAYNYR